MTYPKMSDEEFDRLFEPVIFYWEKEKLDTAAIGEKLHVEEAKVAYMVALMIDAKWF